MGTELYSVRTDFGGLFVRHAYKNEDLTAPEIERLIGDLKMLHEQMIRDDIEQATVKEQLYQLAMKPIWDNCSVFYPCKLDYINGRPNIGSRPNKAKRYCGVYFATHPSMEGLVKIGYSTDVYLRMKTLFYDLGREPLQVIAFIETNAPAEVEAYIHRKLFSDRFEKEWFDYYIAIEWLEGLVNDSST